MKLFVRFKSLLSLIRHETTWKCGAHVIPHTDKGKIWAAITNSRTLAVVTQEGEAQGEHFVPIAALPAKASELNNPLTELEGEHKYTFRKATRNGTVARSEEIKGWNFPHVDSILPELGVGDYRHYIGLTIDADLLKQLQDAIVFPDEDNDSLTMLIPVPLDARDVPQFGVAVELPVVCCSVNGIGLIMPMADKKKPSVVPIAIDYENKRKGYVAALKACAARFMKFLPDNKPAE